MNFSEIIGQKEVIASLKNAIRIDTVGHAYVFAGPDGIGKKTVAEIFAGMLLCNEHRDDAGCGECLPCRMLVSGANPDFKKIEAPDSGIGIESIRELQSDIIIRPMYSARKVYLIVDADKMTAQAQNCLLKTLEEPPQYAVIILTTANYEGLLETIRSRVVKLTFKKNTKDEIVAYLKERRGGSFEALDFAAAYSEGNIGKALEISESEEFIELREKVLEIGIGILKPKTTATFDAYDFFEKNRTSIETLLGIMLMLYRDMLVIRESGKEKILINSDKKDIILRNAHLYSAQKLMRNIEVIENTGRSIKQNANFQLAIEVMLMKLQEEVS